MDWYLYVKVIHVIAAVIWVGGGSALVVLGMAASRAGDDAAMVGVARNVIYLATHLFIPASLVTLLAGVAMVVLGQSFGDLWVIIGLCGFAITFLTGLLVLKPASDRIGAMTDRDGITPAAVAECRSLVRHAKFDHVVMFIVIADMVLKPGPGDHVVLSAMALVAIGSALLFLVGGGRGAVTIRA